MAAQKNKVHGRQVYEDFSGGEYGVTHPRRAAPGTFSGKNVVVYRDGTLGPRNGLVLQPLAGANYVNGALNAFFFGVEHDVATPRMVFSQDVTPAYFEVNDMTAQNPGRFTGPGGTPDPFVFTAEPENGRLAVLERLGFQTLFASLGDATYLLNNLSDEIEEVDPTGAHDLVEYLDQVYQIGLTSAADGSGDVVNYSDHADPTTWPAENTFKVGYAWVVFRALKLFNGLLLINQDSDWYLLQGIVDDGSLRRLEHGRAPSLGNPRSVVARREVAWFLAAGSPGGSFPATFNGSKLDTTSLAHLRGWMSDANATAVHCEADDDLMFVDNDARALMHHEGVWTRHQYEVAVGEWAAHYEDQRFYLAVDGTESTKPVFYRSTFAVTRPPIKDSAFESVGDGSDTPIDAYVEFPELWQEDGAQMRPMFVVLEFTSYDQNVATGAHVACEVDIIDRFGKESTQTVSLGEWDEADAAVASTADGVRRRKIFRGATSAAHMGSALQLRFTDIIGIKIEKAVLDFELGDQLDHA